MENKGLYEQLKESRANKAKKLTIDELSKWIRELYNKPQRHDHDIRPVLMAFDDFPYLSDQEFIGLTSCFKFMGGSEAHQKLMARAKRLNLLPDDLNTIK
jgi:hypothetical protein